MNPAAEIESVARSYLEGQRTLSELEEWLAPTLPFLFQLDESAFASRLAARIESAIAEMDAEGLGESHLKEAIRGVLPPDALTAVAFPAVSDVTFSSDRHNHGRLLEPPEILFEFPHSPFSSSARTEVGPAEPSYTSV